MHCILLMNLSLLLCPPKELVNSNLALLSSSVSPAPGAWWRWTTTAPGSTTAVGTWTMPTSPVSCCWLHWAAHMLPSSSLWPCIHNCMRGSVANTPHFQRAIMFCVFEGKVASFIHSCLAAFFSLLQISFGWSTVKIDMSAVRQFQPLMPFSMPAFAATLFALGLALGTTIAVGMLFFIQV